MTASPAEPPAWLPLEGSGLTLQRVEETTQVRASALRLVAPPERPRALLVERASGATLWHFPALGGRPPAAEPGSRVHELTASRARSLAGWEARERRYAVRLVHSSDARALRSARAEGAAPTVSRAALEGMVGSRVLLLVHGLLSLAVTAFPSDRLEALYASYDHVLSLDHPTITRDPAQNARELLRRLPAGLTVDILSHSRGGLVARALAGELAEAPRPYRVRADKLTVHRLVMVGTPNAGSPISDPRYTPAFLSRLTTLLRWLDGPTDIFDGALQVVGELARLGQQASLPGIYALMPDSPFMKALNRPGTQADDIERYAVTTDFEPKGNVALALLDTVTDALFGSVPNDGLVPTAGVAAAPDGDFPLPRSRVLDVPSRRNVWHLTYFMDDGVVERLGRWLDAGL